MLVPVPIVADSTTPLVSRLLSLYLECGPTIPNRAPLLFRLHSLLPKEVGLANHGALALTNLHHPGIVRVLHVRKRLVSMPFSSRHGQNSITDSEDFSIIALFLDSV